MLNVPDLIYDLHFDLNFFQIEPNQKKQYS